MPPPLTYPGVYIEEMPSGVRTIIGVPTSITAFIGRTWKGPVNDPVAAFGFADFERQFGGLSRHSSVGHAVRHFFLNGGGHAVIVRVVATTTDDGSTPAAPATVTVDTTTLEAANPGSWGRNLKVTVDHIVNPAADTNLFNLVILDDAKTKADIDGRGGSDARETFRNVSMDPASARFVTKILHDQSNLVRVQTLGAARPNPGEYLADPNSGSDGILAGPNQADLALDEVLGTPATKTGIHALLKTGLFNLLCLPPLTFTSQGVVEVQEADIPSTGWGEASVFCHEHRALLLVDAPRDWTVTDAQNEVGTFGSNLVRANAALYFPRVRMVDPARDNQLFDFAASGPVAGVISRTDTARGVWKAPAGIEANLLGVLGLSINGLPVGLTDGENGLLNPLGINCLRNLPTIGHVVWGARTIEGADVFASQWKYVPVRRLALFMEETLFRATQWVVFEPNDEPLWAQIRLNIGAFLHTLFRQGAFQGATPREAYFVKCDKETTTQHDIDSGIVNIVVGFAPLKPAEFVVIKIQQIAQAAQV